MERELEKQRLKNAQMKEQLKKDLYQRQRELQERLITEARAQKAMKQQNEQAIKENSVMFQLENKAKRD